MDLNGRRVATVWWISRAALMARTGSSSWDVGSPKTAIIPSPNTRSTFPWYFNMVSDTLDLTEDIIAWISSGSCFSVRAV